MSTYAYNADGTLASSTDSDVGTTTYGYDACKRPITIVHPDGTSIQIAYNANDQIISSTDENDNAYAYDYDENGNLISLTDPAENTIKYTYDLMDRIIQITDRLGKQTDFTYDNMGQLDSMTGPNGTQIGFSYDSRGWLNQIAAGDQTWQAAYDDEGVVLSSSTTPFGHTMNYQTDKLGYVTGITDPLGNTLTVTRDEMGRVTAETDSLSRTTNYSYDSRGFLSSVTKPVVGTVAYRRNELGLLSQVTDLNGKDWSFDYTKMGRLKSFTDPLSNTWEHTYDSRGKLSRTTYPGGETLDRSYDDAGNLTRKLYADSTDLQYSYDPMDRLIGTNGVNLTWDAESRIINTEDAGTNFGATYDDGGRLKTVTYPLAGPGNGLFTVTYTYDADTGLLRQVSDDLTEAQMEFTYDDDRKLTGITRSNGVHTTYTYDDAARLTRIQEGSLTDLKYTYNAAGEPTQVVRTQPLGSATITYGYDTVGRLIAADYGNENRLDYVYDASGNLIGRTGKTLFGDAKSTDEFHHDAASQVAGPDHAYDLRGRLVSAKEHTYTWDGASRLVGVDNVALTYNGLDDLRTRTEGGQTIHDYYNYALGRNPVVAEKDETTGGFLRYYVWTPRGSLLYMIDAANGDEVRFYHFDRTGSTLALTDASGAVTDAYAYTPYGKLLQHKGTNQQPFTFVARWGVR